MIAAMDISCALAPVPETPAHVALAERLNYRRAWIYDTPALQLDVWVTLARAAERTQRIGLGPGVLIPGLRHVMVTAAAIATLVDLAPDRVVVGIGSGFTGRLAMGQRPHPWTFVKDYVRQLRALLAGETVEVDGGLARMLHGPGQAPRRPIRVPIVCAVGGDKGVAAAREVADGVLSVRPTSGFAWSVLLTQGTVLEPGEPADAERVLRAAGPGAAIVFHRAYENAGGVRGVKVDTLPGGKLWRAAVEAFPEPARHLHTHEGHHTFVNAIDRPVVTGDLVRRYTFTDEAAPLRARLEAFAAQGVTEIAYHPAGPDIERELTAFARMAGIA